MSKVHQMAVEIVKREGGFVIDHAGPTNFGVTQTTLNEHYPGMDVRDLTADQAAEIFKRSYFYGPKINHLPETIRDTVFDMQVNAGSNAIKILQRMLNKMGCNLEVDGAIGPMTIRAANLLDSPILRDIYSIERRNYYYSIADRTPDYRQFAWTRKGLKGGWIKRAEEFMSSEFHFTETQHIKRTDQW